MGSVHAAQTDAAVPMITEYPVTPPINQWDILRNQIWNIAPGADGNLWFVESSNVVASLSTSGNLREFTGGGSDVPTGFLNGNILSAADGNLWMPSLGCPICDPQSPSYLVSVDTNGASVANVLLDFRTVPGALTFGPNSEFWITEQPAFGTSAAPDVLQISATSGGTAFPLPDHAVSARGITTGPDGNLWFAENDIACGDNSGALCSGANARIARLTPSGALTEFAVPTANSFLGEIVTGPDGNLWFTESQGRTGDFPSGGIVARITPQGNVVEFPLPTIGSVPVGIANGADGNLWFTENNANQIGRITPAGTVTEYILPSANSGPLGIAAGSDGNIWFTEANVGKIGKLSLSTPPVVIDGYMSGNWYDSAQSGQGFQLEFTNEGNTAIAIWFTFAPDGSGQKWIYAQGSYDSSNNTVTLPAVLPTGAKFPPNFKSSDVTNTPWGTITFTFTSCTAGSVTWNSTIPGYGSGSMPITRLTSIKGTSCP
jgi:virginiamycin B lyase